MHMDSSSAQLGNSHILSWIRTWQGKNYKHFGVFKLPLDQINKTKVNQKVKQQRYKLIN